MRIICVTDVGGESKDAWRPTSAGDGVTESDMSALAQDSVVAGQLSRLGLGGADTAGAVVRYLTMLHARTLMVDAELYASVDASPVIGRYREAAVLGTVRVSLHSVRHCFPTSWMYSSIPAHPFWVVAVYLALRASESDRIAKRPVHLFEAVHSYRNTVNGDELLAWPSMSELTRALPCEIPYRLPSLSILPPAVLHER